MNRLLDVCVRVEIDIERFSEVCAFEPFGNAPDFCHIDLEYIHCTELPPTQTHTQLTPLEEVESYLSSDPSLRKLYDLDRTMDDDG